MIIGVTPRSSLQNMMRIIPVSTDMEEYTQNEPKNTKPWPQVEDSVAYFFIFDQSNIKNNCENVYQKTLNSSQK